MAAKEQHFEIEQALENLRLRLRSQALSVTNDARNLREYVQEFGSNQQQIDLALILARGYINASSPTDGLVMATDARTLAVESGDDLRKVLADIERGVCLFILHEFDSAEQAYKSALEGAIRCGSLSDRGRVYLNLGNLYNRSSRHTESILNYEQALDVAKQTNDILLQAKVLSNMSTFFGAILMDHDRAISYCLEGKFLYEQLNDTLGLGKASANLGHYYDGVGLHEKALESYLEGLHCKLALSDIFETAMSYYHVIGSLADLGRISEAHRYYQEAIAFLEGEPVESSVWRYLDLAHGSILQSEGRLTDAVVLWERTERWFKSVGLRKDLWILQANMAAIYEKLGRYDEASSRLAEVLEYQDELGKQRAESLLSYVIAKHELEKERGIAELERVRNVELAQAIRLLEETNVEKDHYLAFVAHELKEPMATARSIASLMAHKDQLSDEENTEFISQLEELVNRMKELTHYLTEKRDAVSTTTIVNAVEVWRRVARNWSHRASAKSQTFSIDGLEEPHYVIATEQSLVTIAENLLSNAVKYTPSRGSVCVLIADGTDTIRLCVTDSGPGISLDEQAVMFKPWKTLSARPTGNETSNGLGLHFVHQDVATLGGTIECNSTPGIGTTFTVRLPVVPQRSSDQLDQVNA